MKRFNFCLRAIAAAALFLLACLGAAQAVAGVDASANRREPIARLAAKLKVGDVVFIQVLPPPFGKVSEATMSWTNHVGVVVDVSGKEPVIAESTFPFSRRTTLSRFVARSREGRVAVHRLDKLLTEQQQRQIRHASDKRLGIFYDTGFNLHSSRQFCSKYVREVLAEGTGVTVGEKETFQTLLSRNPEAGLTFWRLWYIGRIPWHRETVTPASLLHSPSLKPVFDGFAG